MAQIFDFGLDDFFGLDTAGSKWLRPLALGTAASVGTFVGGSVVFLLGSTLLGSPSVPSSIEQAGRQAELPAVAAGPPVVARRFVAPPVANPRTALAHTLETLPTAVDPPAPRENAVTTPDAGDAQVPEAQPGAQELKLAALTPKSRPDPAKVRSTVPAPRVAATKPQDRSPTQKPQTASLEAAVARAVPLAPERQELPLARGDQLLAGAFDNLYSSDQIQFVALYALEDGVERPIEILKLARKRIHGRIHSLGILAGTGGLPEIRTLSIESSSHEDERYAYLPGERKALRLSGADALDPFDGTHFNDDDFRPLRLDSYRVAKLEQSSLGNEAVYVITALPLYEAVYDQVEFFVAHEDRAILERRYFRTGHKQPYRVTGHPRKHMETVRGSIQPTRVFVYDLDRGTKAVARIQHVRIADNLDDGLFTLSSFRSPELRIPSP